MRVGISGMRLQRSREGFRRRQIGIADAEIDYIFSARRLLRDPAFQIGEEIEREMVEAMGIRWSQRKMENSEIDSKDFKITVDL